MKTKVAGQVAALEAAVVALIADSQHPSAVRDTLRRIRCSVEDELNLAEQPGYEAGWNRTMDMLLSEPPQPH